MNNQRYSPAFEVAFDHLVTLEGGYVNDATDNGGETKYGISKRKFPDLDISNLTLQKAKEIYWREYWIPNRCEEFPKPLAFALFDGAVNHRVKSSRQLLQVALSVSPDGIIGPVTIEAASHADCRIVLARYLAGRANLYHSIILSNSSQQRFAVGWFKRLFKLQQFILETCWPYVP